jgi:ABC-type nitrate/sulfonate/bicarbonate transport system substrate-binding protein
VARPDYYDDNKEVLANIIRGWAEANDYIVRNMAAAAEALQKKEPLSPRQARRYHRGIQGAEDVLIAGMEATPFRRHRYKMAVAGQRFLHEGRWPYRHEAGCGIF